MKYLSSKLSKALNVIGIEAITNVASTWESVNAAVYRTALALYWSILSRKQSDRLTPDTGA